MAFQLPNFQQFVTPYGANTNPGFASNAASAYGQMFSALANASRPSDALSPQTAAAQAKGQSEAARYGAIGGVGTNYASNYDAYSRGVGQLGANVANQYGAYGNTLGGVGNAAAGGFNSLAQAIASMRGADANAGNALGGAFAGYGNALASGYGAYGNTLSSLGGAFSNNLGHFSSGLGSLSQAMANERSNLASSNAMAEAARQGSVGNIGAAALGAFGSASNAAMGAWAQNQAAYNNALANMYSANQGALSNFGQSRNNALGTAAQAYANTATGVAPAAAIGNLSATFGGDGGMFGGSGFSANDGGIASGSYGGGGGSGGFSGSVTRTSDGSLVPGIASSAFGGIDGARANIMDNSVLSALVNPDGFNRLDAQHATSRNTPFTELGGILGGIRGLGQDAYSESRSGMDQFYQNAPRPTDYTPLFGLLQQRAESADANVQGLANDAGSGFNSMQSGLGSRFDTTQADLGAGLAMYNSGSGGAMGALAGGYGGFMGALGGIADSARDGFEGSTAAQAGLLSSLGGAFNNANQFTDSVFDYLQPDAPPSPASPLVTNRAADSAAQAAAFDLWSQYPQPPKPVNSAFVRRMDENNKRTAAEAQQARELMAQGWTWNGNAGGWRPPAGNPMATYTPSAAATYRPPGPPTGPLRLATGNG